MLRSLVDQALQKSADDRHSSIIFRAMAENIRLKNTSLESKPVHQISKCLRSLMKIALNYSKSDIHRRSIVNLTFALDTRLRRRSQETQNDISAAKDIISDYCTAVSKHITDKLFKEATEYHEAMYLRDYRDEFPELRPIELSVVQKDDSNKLAFTIAAHEHAVHEHSIHEHAVHEQEPSAISVPLRMDESKTVELPDISAVNMDVPSPITFSRPLVTALVTPLPLPKPTQPPPPKKRAAEEQEQPSKKKARTSQTKPDVVFPVPRWVAEAIKGNVELLYEREWVEPSSMEVVQSGYKFYFEDKSSIVVPHREAYDHICKVKKGVDVGLLQKVDKLTEISSLLVDQVQKLRDEIKNMKNI